MSAYIQFGSGLLIIVPNAGNLAVDPTPVKPLTVQDITIDISGDLKSLKGQYQWPDDVATADKKGTFKFAMGRKDFNAINQIFSADTTAAGGNSAVINEIHVVTGGAATVTPPGSGTFFEDGGVTYGNFGAALTRLPSGSPAIGQYTVSAGVYTFASGDNTHSVSISYVYTLSSAGTTYQVNQQPQGYGPQFECYIVDQYQPVNGIYSVIHLYAAKINKIAMVNKRVDYCMPEFDGEYFANATTGRVIDYYSNV